MSAKEPGSNRGRKSMGLRTVEVGIPVEQYEVLERYAGRGGISNAIRSAVCGLLNAVDDEMFADVFPLRWVEGAEPCGRMFPERGAPKHDDAAVVVPASGPIPVEGALGMAGIEPQPGEVISVPRSGGLVSRVFAGREAVDAKDRQRVLDCLRERARSGRDVAKALGLDVGTVGLVVADLVRDGVVRQRRDKVLELA